MARPREAASAPPGLIIDPAMILAASGGQASPTAATSETPTIYLHDGTEQSGPFTLTQLQSMLHDGTISRETSYWSEGMSDWQTVADLAILYK